MKLWWLSYADEEGFRGVIIADCADFLDATIEARRRGVSPGGQVLGFLFDADDETAPDSFREWLATAPRWTLLQRADLPANDIIDAGDAVQEPVCVTP